MRIAVDMCPTERLRIDAQAMRMALGELAEVGPNAGKPVERSRGPCIVVAAVREDPACWKVLVRRHEDRIVGHF